MAKEHRAIIHIKQELGILGCKNPRGGTDSRSAPSCSVTLSTAPEAKTSTHVVNKTAAEVEVKESVSSVAASPGIESRTADLVNASAHAGEAAPHYPDPPCSVRSVIMKTPRGGLVREAAIVRCMQINQLPIARSQLSKSTT